MVQVGTFILAFGWFGFNAGSSLAGSDGRIGIVAVNTMIAGMAATMSGVIYMWTVHGKPDPSMMCNSMLAGLVAITSPCAFVTPVGAFIIGLVAGVLVVWSVSFFDRIKIDDPVGAISVHGVNGAWGLIAVGLFSDGSYGQGWNGVGATDYLGVAGKGVAGLFYGDSKQLVAQFIETGVGIAWNVVVGGVIFFVIGKVLGSNRVSAAVEIAGLDIPEMGMAGYPEFIKVVSPEDLADDEEDHAADDDVPGDPHPGLDELRDELLAVSVKEARDALARDAQVVGRADAVPALAVRAVREQADGDEPPGSVDAMDADSRRPGHRS